MEGGSRGRGWSGRVGIQSREGSDFISQFTEGARPRVKASQFDFIAGPKPPTFVRWPEPGVQARHTLHPRPGEPT